VGIFLGLQPPNHQEIHQFINHNYYIWSLISPFGCLQSFKPPNGGQKSQNLGFSKFQSSRMKATYERVSNLQYHENGLKTAGGIKYFQNPIRVSQEVASPTIHIGNIKI
jgi:hypothetical protein